jgi:aminocarboxymuconate-semialdehyde decarboxylase
MSGRQVIDFHAHIVCGEVLGRCQGRNVLAGWKQGPFIPPAGAAALVPKLTNPDEALADMDRLGIDISVISTSTVMQNTAWAEPAEQAELETIANNEIARWMAHAPGRFSGAFTVPLSDMDLAVKELERCDDELNMRVVNLPAVVGANYLGAPRFEPIWAAIHDRDLVAFLHPDGARDPWYQDYWLWNSIGQPIEEAKLLTSLIMEGVLERHSGVKVVVAHGGGFLPHYSGRIDRILKNQPEEMVNISSERKPSDYLFDLYYDTCAYDKSVLDALLRRFGPERLVMGSDYPVGEADPLGFARAGEGVDAGASDAILGGTAERLLGL